MLCHVIPFYLLTFLLLSCSVSYKFNGASIDYSKTKTIQIADFPIRSSYVWGPMANIFNTQLKDQYANHTKLIQVKRNGDLRLEGEITRYDQRNKSVSSEGYSAQTDEHRQPLRGLRAHVHGNGQLRVHTVAELRTGGTCDTDV